ncbi:MULTISPECIES: conjugative transposon protein TraK [Larkinella]|jgi:conjugative transposon TraK protein|uniref:Conjugative transposon protein TraK n=1 Tax=Larkinella punicea TaxID=2315727 RepID=A0A368JLP5_9BACT|nr:MULTISPECIES: conjugative transposon protein TraK [Larkinella]RCR67061.1 conjugative transposon protein TraK [Larkinella punicea]
MAQDQTFFKSLRNLETSYRNIRILSIIIITACVMMTIGSLVFAYKVDSDADSRVYVVEQGKTLIAALRKDVRENRPVEARDHIRRFHELFFTLDPDGNSIEEHIREALPYGDESIQRLYLDTKEKGYYNNLIQAAASQEIQVDSIRLDLNQYPYRFRSFARQQIIRLTKVTTRRLITDGYLRNVSRSEVNPHGFLIEQLDIVDNSDIEERLRR